METPRIWYTRWMTDPDTQVGFDFVCRRGQVSRTAFSDAVRYCRPVDDAHVPEFLHFERHAKVPGSCRDAFRTEGGLLVCSRAFRNVLVQHRLGSTRLHEVPVCRDRSGTPSDLPPHFLLHVTEGKAGTFAPRDSRHIRQFQRSDERLPRPHAPWTHVDNQDELAVTAACAGRTDLWHDPSLRGRLFLSDRLKRAIDAAGLRSRALRLHEARIVQ